MIDSKKIHNIKRNQNFKNYFKMIATSRNQLKLPKAIYISISLDKFRVSLINLLHPNLLGILNITKLT